MVDHQKHLRAKRWTSVREEQVYIPPEERQQPKSWEQTNEEGKKTTNKIKLNDKKSLHHSHVNFGSKEAFMHCFTVSFSIIIEGVPLTDHMGALHP